MHSFPQYPPVRDAAIFLISKMGSQFISRPYAHPVDGESV